MIDSLLRLCSQDCDDLVLVAVWADEEVRAIFRSEPIRILGRNLRYLPVILCFVPVWEVRTPVLVCDVKVELEMLDVVLLTRALSVVYDLLTELFKRVTTLLYLYIRVPLL